MNLPKIWFAHSFTLIHYQIDPDFSFEEYKQLREETKPLRELLEKYGKEISINIEKYTGISWLKKEIPIYLVPDKDQKSFSHPLILVLRENYFRRFQLLTHELVHINTLANSDNLFIDDYPLMPLKGIETEAVIWMIARKVLNKVSTQDDWLKFEEEFKWWESSKSGQTIFEKVKEFEEKWDLNKKPLIDWIKGTATQ